MKLNAVQVRSLNRRPQLRHRNLRYPRIVSRSSAQVSVDEQRGHYIFHVPAGVGLRMVVATGVPPTPLPNSSSDRTSQQSSMGYQPRAGPLAALANS